KTPSRPRAVLGKPIGRRIATWLLLSLAALLSLGCYSLSLTTASPDQTGPAPEKIAAIFADRTDGKVDIELVSPGGAYLWDPAEKDRFFAADEGSFVFQRGEISLRREMPHGTVLVDLEFVDGQGNRALAERIDLLRLVPRIDTEGNMQYPELLLEEYTRTSISLRGEHQEFSLETGSDDATLEAADRAYRMTLSNNCLDPSKWEVAIVTADESDFGERLRGPTNLNQNRLLAHSWFYLEPALYTALIEVKNPQLELDPAWASDYDGLSAKAEAVQIDFDALRQLSHRESIEVLEIGSRSGRTIEPLDREQYFKWDYGLFVNKDRFTTFADLLEAPVELAIYADRGFYDPNNPKVFDYSWLTGLDQVDLGIIDNRVGDTYAEITLGGADSPYRFTIGNVDLALLDEQRLYSVPFGFNTYPLSRRHTPRQSTISYDQDLLPAELKQYFLMTDAQSGNWVNNQVYGFDRVYLGWDSIDRDVIVISLISYERIIPVWMAKIKLDDELVDRIRIRRNFYS
ncbi:MAG: hypothetical protein AAF772_11155, partial [Acidobacteriota bacterium]